MKHLRFVPGYESAIYEPGIEPLFFVSLVLLIAYALVRRYTRLGPARAWGSRRVRGVQHHHVVPGIVRLFVGGLTPFSGR